MIDAGAIGSGIANVEKTLKVLCENTPLPMPQLDLGTVPDVSAANPLAGYFGVHKPLITTVALALDKDVHEIGGVFGQSLGPISAAQHELFDLAMRYVQDIVALAVKAFSFNPAVLATAQAEAEILSTNTQAAAVARSGQLAKELAPLTEKLNAIAEVPAQSSNISVPEAVPAPESAEGAPHATEPAEKFVPASSDNISAGQQAVNAALTQLGTPYVWGGTTPGAGFDCSGLTQWAWRQAGVELPRLAQEQNIGRAVSVDELIPGDLLVWDGHVAMYKGDGQIVEAGDPVQTGPLRTTNSGMAFKGYFRPTG